MTLYWLSSEKMTVQVLCDDEDIIRDGAPIIFKFRNQPLVNLERWMEKQGGFKKEVLGLDVDQTTEPIDLE